MKCMHAYICDANCGKRNKKIERVIVCLLLACVALLLFDERRKDAT